MTIDNSSLDSELVFWLVKTDLVTCRRSAWVTPSISVIWIITTRYYSNWLSSVFLSSVLSYILLLLSFLSQRIKKTLHFQSFCLLFVSGSGDASKQSVLLHLCLFESTFVNAKPTDITLVYQLEAVCFVMCVDSKLLHTVDRNVLKIADSAD